MAENADQLPAINEIPTKSTTVLKKESGTVSKQKRGILSRIWNGIFRRRNDDFEKRLQHLSKEEASVHARMKRRAQRWRRTARNLIIFSVILEVVSVAYAVMTTRSLDLDWKMRAIRVLPMFVLPGDRKDQKTLERLCAERQAKIDELKERTNYYLTQQLIQRYDPDPAAKAAAASILASKLGAESGLKVYLGDEPKSNVSLGKSNDVELVESSGLRKRKQFHTRNSSTGSGIMQQVGEEMPQEYGLDNPEVPEQNQAVVVKHHKGSAVNDGGWIARIAAMLVGEDPTQCYALICGNCHMHNGLARKEDFAYITYYCPHCHALNGSQPSDGLGSGASSSKVGTPISGNNDEKSKPSSSEVSSASAAVMETAAERKDTGAPAVMETAAEGKDTGAPAVMETAAEGKDTGALPN
ncbi:uncharacterized protein At2g24330-like isoform X2 [Tasmannia lanceolata]|uniref:uncharacterized protein At2g24330-like isoform X2 n=1 Tax=Tasmannia lanceolata TaxID=3420 RepID=UPI0040646EFB